MFERLKLLKEQSGMTAKEIAEKSDIPESTINRIFSGKTLNPTITTMASIMDAMGYTLGDLFQGKAVVDLDPQTDDVVLNVENDIQEPKTNCPAVPENLTPETYAAHIEASKINGWTPCPFHDRTTEMYKNAIKNYEKRLKHIIRLCYALGILLFTILMLDILNPAIGFIQY